MQYVLLYRIILNIGPDMNDNRLHAVWYTKIFCDD